MKKKKRNREFCNGLRLLWSRYRLQGEPPADPCNLIVGIFSKLKLRDRGPGKMAAIVEFDRRRSAELGVEPIFPAKRSAK